MFVFWIELQEKAEAEKRDMEKPAQYGAEDAVL